MVVSMFLKYTLAILCSAKNFVSSDNWPILFKVLMCIVLLYESNFGLGLSSVANFSNTGARTPTSAGRASCCPARKTMRFGHMVSISHGNRFLPVFFFFISSKDTTFTDE